MLNLFRRKPAATTASDAARTLGELARASNLSYRERVRAKARQMRADMGLPPAPELESR